MFRLEMKLALRPLMICALAFPAAARCEAPDFSGVWQGSGALHDSSEREFDCPSLRVQIRHESDRLVLESFRHSCGGMIIRLKRPLETRVDREGNLFIQDFAVGRLTDDGFEIRYDRSELGTFFYSFRLDSEGRATYLDHIPWSSKYSTKVEGALIR